MTNSPKTLTGTECHQLLAVLRSKGGTPKQQKRGIRNYAMALLMLDSGLRVGEVVKLSGHALMFGMIPVSTIIVEAVVAKNGLERQIPATRKLQNAVIELAKWYWYTDVNLTTPFAFYNNDPNKPLTVRQVERIIKAAGMVALGRPIHPHVLRHTFATKLMRVVNARVVQQLLGHKNLSSTQVYTHPNQDDLTKAINQLEDDFSAYDDLNLSAGDKPARV